MSRRVERRFVNQDQVSRHLICSICTDIFLEPTRLFCGHTFCKKCISHWTNDHNNCPFCREEIQTKLMGKDLTADKIIQDLQVECPNSTCHWKDSLEHLEKHYKDCSYTKSPDWLEKVQDYIKIEEDSSPLAASWSNIANIKPIRPNPVECVVQNIPQSSIFERINQDVYYMTFIEKFYSGPSRTKGVFENLSQHSFARRRRSASGNRPLDFKDSFLLNMSQVEEEKQGENRAQKDGLFEESLRSLEKPLTFGESNRLKQSLINDNTTSTKLGRKRRNLKQAMVDAEIDDNFELLKTKHVKGSSKRRGQKLISLGDQLPGETLAKKNKATLV